MNYRGLFSWLLGCAVLVGAQNDSFTVKPSLKPAAGAWQVEFAVNKAMDVTVAIVNLKDSTVVRHLAGGMLGAQAPAPLVPDSLHQVIAWDGKDDLGNAAAHPESLSVRVRAGMNVQLLAMVGNNPYAYKGVNSSGGAIDGITVLPDGSVYVLARTGSITFNSGAYMSTLRQFDKNGNYVKTVFPFPSNLSASQVQGWGVITWPDNSYTPKATTLYVPGLTSTILSPNNSANGQLFSYGDSDKVVVGTLNGLLAVGTDGSMPGTGQAKKLITTPALPGSFYQWGPLFLTPVQGRDFAYLSGICQAQQSSGHLVAVSDTGFWKDGQVFKVNLTTGVAVSWLALDSVPKTIADRRAKFGGGEYYAPIHGTDYDAQGRVYICDRIHHRIGVYDSNAVFLGSIPVRNPDVVRVNRASGTVYVAARSQSAVTYYLGLVRLYKFAPFDQGGAQVCSLSLSTTVSSKPYHVQMALSQANAQPWIWISYWNDVMPMAIRDDGASFGIARDFYAETKASTWTTGYEHIGVDRRNDALYINDSFEKLFKIENWANPVAVTCSTSARKPLNCAEFDISFNNLLYARECTGACFTGPIRRYTLDHLHSPVNWANTGGNMQTAAITNRSGAGIGERGMAVAPDGRTAAMQYGAIGGNVYYVSVYPDSGSSATSIGKLTVAPILDQSGGVKYDLKGNLYVGAKIRDAAHQIPAPFTGDWGYTKGVGAVIKYNAGDTGSVTASGAPGAAKVYLPGLAPFSKDGGSACICRSPRFEVDLYGRLFIPNAITNQVTVVDNSGNEIARFGKYGNWDSRGGLEGPGTLIPGTAIPMAWPSCVAASEDYIYVSDMGNGRLLRVRMNYALDNVPGFTAHTASAELENACAPLAIASSPNPFTPRSNILFNLPARASVRLEVLSASGKVVKVLQARDMMPGVHRLSWDGMDDRSMPVAAGVYFYVLSAGNKVRVSRTVLVK